MKLFVGLGNPGAEYSRHRHNAGFMAVDRIADRHRFGPWKKKFSGLAADGEIAGRRVLLLKPQTFMNDSGRAVAEAARFLKLPEADVIVFYDEIDLDPGKLKVKTGGGNAGHNGLRSITPQIGNDYVRVRIGIGHPGIKDAVARYVLHDFAKAEYLWLDPLLDAIADTAGRLTDNDHARFLTEINRRLQTSDVDPVKDPVVKPGTKPKPAPHPAGERSGKRQSALANNLKKWLQGRKPV